LTGRAFGRDEVELDVAAADFLRFVIGSAILLRLQLFHFPTSPFFVVLALSNNSSKIITI